jgi:hypothetical protein
MRKMVLDVVLVKLELPLLHSAFFGDHRMEVVKSPALATHPREVQKASRMPQHELHLLVQVRTGIPSNRDSIDIRKIKTGAFQASKDRKPGEAREVLDSVQALLRNGRNRLAVHQERRGRTRVKGIYPQDHTHNLSESTGSRIQSSESDPRTKPCAGVNTYTLKYFPRLQTRLPGWLLLRAVGAFRHSFPEEMDVMMVIGGVHSGQLFEPHFLKF